MSFLKYIILMQNYKLQVAVTPDTEVLRAVQAASASFFVSLPRLADEDVETPPTVTVQVQVYSFLQEVNIVAIKATATTGKSFFISLFFSLCGTKIILIFKCGNICSSFFK